VLVITGVLVQEREELVSLPEELPGAA
jgi:hypothetical protein